MVATPVRWPRPCGGNARGPFSLCDSDTKNENRQENGVIPLIYHHQSIDDSLLSSHKKFSLISPKTAELW